MNQVFIVTGGAGFIGSHIVERILTEQPYAVVRVFDNFSTGRLGNLPFRMTVGDRLEIIEGDIRDSRALAEVVRGAAVVFHQAALVSVPKSVEDPIVADEHNVTGTLNVFEAARRADVKRVVYASSSAVYGNLPGERKREDQPTAPISPYGVAKMVAEQYAAVWTRLYQVEAVGLRYFNVFGPRQDPRSEYAAVVPRFIMSALQGSALEIHGDGLQSRDFVYVENVARANLAAAQPPKAAGEVFNIGSGSPTTVLHLLGLLEAALGCRLSRRHTDPRVADIVHIYADLEKTRKVLGDIEVVSLEDGLRRTIEHFAVLGSGGC